MMDDKLRSDIVGHRMRSARTCYDEALYLRKGRFYNAAMTRFYYACFHASSALLIANGIEVKTHNGIRQKLGQEFVQTGKLPSCLGRFYTNLFNKRQDGDYDDFIFFEDADLEEVQPQVAEFIACVQELIDSNDTIK
ncbi:HEPN domain-containing protein [Parabacteroides sp.]